MKYYFLNGNMQKPLPEGVNFPELLDKHHQYAAKFLANGQVLCCGPKPGMEGGIFVFKAEAEDEMNVFVNNDPFVINGITKYDITEFNFFNEQDIVKPWFGK